MSDRDLVTERKRRLSFTNYARIQLLLSPLLMFILIVCSLVMAVGTGLAAFGERFGYEWREDWRWLYRDVYRVARYGSVWDDR